tara:strand:- start:763 stop:1053 length:291 start_codon:yes stop_codon:yes gene_type:complete
MTSPLYAITATDDNGNDWIAVNEPIFGGWCAMTPEDVRIRMRTERNLSEGPIGKLAASLLHRDVYDHYGYAVALMHCATVMTALPAFKWSVKRFER